MTSTDEYPLSCVNGLINDAFAGWFAVSDDGKCNDFCFWSGPNNTNVLERMVADPHQQTTTQTGDYWGCFMDAAGDEVMIQDIDTYYEDFSGDTFDYLRCSRGAGEVLVSNFEAWLESRIFWGVAISISLLILGMEIVFFVKKRKSRNFKRQIQLHRQQESQSSVSVILDEDSIIAREKDVLEMRVQSITSIIQENEEDEYYPQSASFKTIGDNIEVSGNGPGEIDEVEVSRPATAPVIEDNPEINVVGIPSSPPDRNLENVASQTQEAPMSAETSRPDTAMSSFYAKFLQMKTVRSIWNIGASQRSPNNPVSNANNRQKTKCEDWFVSNRTNIWYYFRIAHLSLFNLVLLAIIFLSSLSLVEIAGNINLSFSFKTLTPTCTDIDNFCPDGNVPVQKWSKPRSEAMENFKPFSYMIASDSQLDWYDGESAYLGKMNYPPPCSERDSCSSCSAKMGNYTNSQMKKSFELLIERQSKRSGRNGAPKPKTLVMNGDLTQYFHKDERDRYEAFYHGIDGLEQYFPSLGNHDYDQYYGATYNGDEWIGTKTCNGKHAVGYFKGAFCGNIPNFEAKDKITRYDPESLAYSWEEGPYHFVHLHYHPLYENAGVGIANSVQWLEQDLKLAESMDLTTILFVHSVQMIPPMMETMILENNVAAIFTGHLHRCFFQNCDSLIALNTNEAGQHFNRSLNEDGGDQDNDRIEKCYPAAEALSCLKGSPRGQSLFYVNDMDENMALPENKLSSPTPIQKGLCPVSLYGKYINETDNTALCRRVSVPARFPFESVSDSVVEDKSIPIFWSGSASFQTFLLVDFYDDRIVVNAMTGTEGNEGKRYVDVHEVPNAVYPYQNSESLEEVTIYI